MSKIEVDGKEYKVIENLGYQGGHYAKMVLVEGKECVVVKHGKMWRWWAVKDRFSDGGGGRLCGQET